MTDNQQPQDTGAKAIVVRMCARCGEPSGGGDLCPPCELHVASMVNPVQDTADQEVPDAAKLTDEEMRQAIGSPALRPAATVTWQIADAATEKAWHSRDAEVADLREESEAMRKEMMAMSGVAKCITEQRDAALAALLATDTPAT